VSDSPLRGSVLHPETRLRLRRNRADNPPNRDRTCSCRRQALCSRLQPLPLPQNWSSRSRRQHQARRHHRFHPLRLPKQQDRRRMRELGQRAWHRTRHRGLSGTLCKWRDL